MVDKLEVEHKLMMDILELSVSLMKQYYGEMAEQKEAFEDQARKDNMLSCMEYWYAEFLDTAEYTESDIIYLDCKL